MGAIAACIFCFEGAGPITGGLISGEEEGGGYSNKTMMDIL